MKVEINYCHTTPDKGLNLRVRKPTLPLVRLRQIDKAIVHSAREHEAIPLFRVLGHLVTPGPDGFAETRDQTLAAALVKVTRQVADTISARADKQRARHGFARTT